MLAALFRIKYVPNYAERISLSKNYIYKEIKKLKTCGEAAPQLSIVNSTLSIAGIIMFVFNYFIDRQIRSQYMRSVFLCLCSNANM